MHPYLMIKKKNVVTHTMYDMSAYNVYFALFDQLKGYALYI